MYRMRTVLGGVALVLALAIPGAPASAVSGYDSSYAGESAFLTLAAGETGSFTVFFLNSGTTTWTKGTSTQVDLAACLSDKLLCNAQDASETPFNNGWLSTTRYATATQAAVGPGQIATFTYSVKVPAGTSTGIFRFNGALVKADTGEDIHNEGYYQDVFVPTTPASITITPQSGTNQIDTSHNVTIQYVAPAGASATGVIIDIFVVDNVTPFTTAGQCNRDPNANSNFTGQVACQVDVNDPVTDNNGKIQFSFNGNAKETHRIIAWTAPTGTVYNSTNTSLVQGSATKTWIAFVSGLDVEPNSKTSPFSTSTTLTAQLEETDGTTPIAASGQTVIWHVVRTGSDVGATCTGGTTIVVQTTTTDATGKATFTYNGPADPNTAAQGNSTLDCVFAFHDKTGNATFEGGSDPSDAIQVTWSDASPGTGNTVVLTPSSDGNPINSNYTVTASMKDVFGSAVVGAVITFQVTRVQATSSTTAVEGIVLTGTRTTDGAGNASFTYTGPGYASSDTIDACGDKNNDNDCVDADDVPFTSVTEAQKHWAPEGPNSGGNYTGTALNCDTVNDTLYLFATGGPQTGNVRLVYDTSDQFFLDGTPDATINGSGATYVAWESKCAAGDTFTVSYNNAGISQFENESKAP